MGQTGRDERPIAIAMAEAWRTVGRRLRRDRPEYFLRLLELIESDVVHAAENIDETDLVS